MYMDIQHYVLSCESCLMKKNPKQREAVSVLPILLSARTCYTTLLHYQNQYPFYLVLRLALFLVLVQKYVTVQLATYAFFIPNETYQSTNFIPSSHCLFTHGYQDAAPSLYWLYLHRAPQTATSTLAAFPNLFDGTGFFWGKP